VHQKVDKVKMFCRF